MLAFPEFYSWPFIHTAEFHWSISSTMVALPSLKCKLRPFSWVSNSNNDCLLSSTKQVCFDESQAPQSQYALSTFAHYFVIDGMSIHWVISLRNLKVLWCSPSSPYSLVTFDFYLLHLWNISPTHLLYKPYNIQDTISSCPSYCNSFLTGVSASHPHLLLFCSSFPNRVI